MLTLYHHPLCPHSRFVRLLLGEYGLQAHLIEEKVQDRRHEFLLLNPAGQTPVLIEGNDVIIPGTSAIAEYLDETRGLGLGPLRLLPENILERIETRRLEAWFSQKFHSEVSDWLIHEKIHKRYLSSADGGGSPDMRVVRAARTNIRTHLRYIGYLAGRRKWLAGDNLSHADLAAAAQISCVDFLGDVPWEEDATAKVWYARMKSRPSFRQLLTDRLPGLNPAPDYADLDF